MSKSHAYNTDPYEETPEPDPDRLLEKGSSTPLMTSASGIVRIVVMMAMAAVMIYAKANAPPLASNPNFGGLPFPPEIKIHGSQQQLLGGGAASFGALAVYVGVPSGSMAMLFPSSRVSPVQHLSKGLILNTDAERLDALAAKEGVEKSLLVVFNGRTAGVALGRQVADALALGEMDSDREGVAAVQGALDAAVQVEIPPEGAQLYMTCDRKALHVAYGAPADGGRARNMAPVTASLKDNAYGAPRGICTALFNAVLAEKTAIAPDAAQGVASVLASQSEQAADAKKHDEL